MVSPIQAQSALTALDLSDASAVHDQGLAPDIAALILATIVKPNTDAIAMASAPQSNPASQAQALTATDAQSSSPVTSDISSVDTQNVFGVDPIDAAIQTLLNSAAISMTGLRFKTPLATKETTSQLPIQRLDLSARADDAHALTLNITQGVGADTQILLPQQSLTPQNIDVTASMTPSPTSSPEQNDAHVLAWQATITTALPAAPSSDPLIARTMAAIDAPSATPSDQTNSEPNDQHVKAWRAYCASVMAPAQAYQNTCTYLSDIAQSDHPQNTIAAAHQTDAAMIDLAAPIPTTSTTTQELTQAAIPAPNDQSSLMPNADQHIMDWRLYRASILASQSNLQDATTLQSSQNNSMDIQISPPVPATSQPAFAPQKLNQTTIDQSSLAAPADDHIKTWLAYLSLHPDPSTLAPAVAQNTNRDTPFHAFANGNDASSTAAAINFIDDSSAPSLRLGRFDEHVKAWHVEKLTAATVSSSTPSDSAPLSIIADMMTPAMQLKNVNSSSTLHDIAPTEHDDKNSQQIARYDVINADIMPALNVPAENVITSASTSTPNVDVANQYLTNQSLPTSAQPIANVLSPQNLPTSSSLHIDQTEDGTQNVHNLYIKTPRTHDDDQQDMVANATAPKDLIVSQSVTSDTSTPHGMTDILFADTMSFHQPSRAAINPAEVDTELSRTPPQSTLSQQNISQSDLMSSRHPHNMASLNAASSMNSGVTSASSPSSTPPALSSGDDIDQPHTREDSASQQQNTDQHHGQQKQPHIMPNNDATESPKSLTKATVQNVLAHQQPTSATALQSQADTLSGTTTTLVTNTALLPSTRVDSAELQLINTVNPSPQQPATEGASLQQTSSPQNQLSDQFEPKYAFVKQIINALHDGKSELRLSLYPAQLGQVVIAMSLEGQHLSIDLKTSSQDAQDALTLGEDSLKEALTREGFILDSFAISNRPDENKRRPPHRQAPSQQTARSSSPDVQFSIDMIA